MKVRLTNLSSVDPIGCGCTDCLVGYSKPLNALTDEELMQLLLGKLEDRCSAEFVITAEAGPAKPGAFRDPFTMGAFAVTVEGTDLSWTISSSQMRISCTLFRVRTCANNGCENEAGSHSAYCTWKCRNEDDRH